MVRVEDAVIAKLKKENQNFEILVDCELALKFRRGEIKDIRDVLAAPNIFKDARKGDIAPDLQKMFGTENIDEVAAQIVRKGEIHLTTAYKKKLIDEKKSRIIAMIARNAMDPVRRIPIPRTRIELAMEKISTSIDPFRSVEEQMEDVVAKLRVMMPITFENRKFEVLIPANYASACYGILKKYGKIIKEEWLHTGSLKATVEMPAGVSEDFVNDLNKKTSGDIQLTEIK